MYALAASQLTSELRLAIDKGQIEWTDDDFRDVPSVYKKRAAGNQFLKVSDVHDVSAWKQKQSIVLCYIYMEMNRL